MKYINWALAALFALFAYFQYNDPDPWIWLTIYLVIAAAFGLAALGKYYKWLILGCGAVCLILLLVSLPGLLDYVFNQDGYTILEGMSNDKPYIEQSREFGGALISLGALGFLWWQTRRAA